MASLLSFTMASASWQKESGKADIRIQLKGVKNDKGGRLLICLFQNEPGFPDKGASAYRIFRSGPSGEILLPEIPAGTYALSVLHDFNGDERMNYSFPGIPAEGFSSSPDGGGKWRKPDFTSSSFRHQAPGTSLKMQMHYLP